MLPLNFICPKYWMPLNLFRHLAFVSHCVHHLFVPRHTFLKGNGMLKKIGQSCQKPKGFSSSRVLLMVVWWCLWIPTWAHFFNLTDPIECRMYIRIEMIVHHVAPEFEMSKILNVIRFVQTPICVPLYWTPPHILNIEKNMAKIAKNLKELAHLKIHTGGPRPNLTQNQNFGNTCQIFLSTWHSHCTCEFTSVCFHLWLHGQQDQDVNLATWREYKTVEPMRKQALARKWRQAWI